MKYMLAIISSLGGGVLVGGALAAFITLIQVFPRLIQLTETERFLKYYEDIYIFSAFIFTVIYFSDFFINIGNLGIVIFGLIFGIYIGIFASALAETLNVLPIISKKFKIKKKFEIVVIALLLGKTLGALYYFIILSGGLDGKLK